MAPPPPFGANSAAARDIANVLHPYTDLQDASAGRARWSSRAARACACGTTPARTTSRASPACGAPRSASTTSAWCRRRSTQMRKLPFYHAFTAKSHEPLIDLAEMLIQRAPVPMSKVFFANSGSEANDSAIKMIWYFNNALGPAGEEEDHRPAEGLSRHHPGLGVADRHAAQPPRVRPAAAGLHPHDDARTTTTAPSRARARRRSRRAAPMSWRS